MQYVAVMIDEDTYKNVFKKELRDIDGLEYIPVWEVKHITDAGYELWLQHDGWYTGENKIEIINELVIEGAKEINFDKVRKENG